MLSFPSVTLIYNLTDGNVYSNVLIVMKVMNRIIDKLQLLQSPEPTRNEFDILPAMQTNHLFVRPDILQQWVHIHEPQWPTMGHRTPWGLQLKAFSRSWNVEHINSSLDLRAVFILQAQILAAWGPCTGSLLLLGLRTSGYRCQMFFLGSAGPFSPF